MNFSKSQQSIIFIVYLFASPQIYEWAKAEESAQNRPNIIWIFVEDMNGWCGCYGDSTVTTPNIDEIASLGVRFDRAYMPAGVCSATRSAIATVAMQTSLGIHNHRSSRQRVPNEVIKLPNDVKTVYQLMREAGYYVYSNAGKNDFNFIFEQEDLYDKIVEPKMGFSGKEWDNRQPGQPFFGQIQLLGGKSIINKKQKAKAKTDRCNPGNVTVPPYYPDVPIIREEIAHHYDCIKKTDQEVGEILAALEEDGLLDKTVVFFFSDHGMRLYRHKQWLYEGGFESLGSDGAQN